MQQASQRAHLGRPPALACTSTQKQLFCPAPKQGKTRGPRDAPHPELNCTSLSQEQQQQRLLRAPQGHSGQSQSPGRCTGGTNCLQEGPRLGLDSRGSLQGLHQQSTLGTSFNLPEPEAFIPKLWPKQPHLWACPHRELGLGTAQYMATTVADTVTSTVTDQCRPMPGPASERQTMSKVGPPDTGPGFLGSRDWANPPAPCWGTGCTVHSAGIQLSLTAHSRAWGLLHPSPDSAKHGLDPCAGCCTIAHS